MFLSKSLMKGRMSTLAQMHQCRYISKHLSAFATIDPENLKPNDKGFNLVNGEWVSSKSYMDLVDPLNGGNMCKIPDT